MNCESTTFKRRNVEYSMSNETIRDEARWNAAAYNNNYAYVWERAADLLALLAPQRGERILDIGCGTGRPTAQIAAAGARVKGIDSSPDMIREAHRNYPDLEFAVADARDFRSDERFDAVFSNAALHWMKEPEHVAESVHLALKPGGRFVAEMGGKGDVEKITSALRRARAELGFPLPESVQPWYFPSVGEYASVLEAAGLEVTFASLFDRPTALEEGEAALGNWIRMFGAGFMGGVPAELREEVIRRIERQLRDELFHDGVWYTDYRRLRVVAYKRA
jgi:trans-aconitate methyltransferase